MTEKDSEKLRREISGLKQRLETAEETLRAITSGEVDALLVNTNLGERVFTLQGADTFYRTAIENINEGAITLAPDGTILYSNRCFAERMQVSLNHIIGTSIFDFAAPEARSPLASLLKKASGRIEVLLRSGRGTAVPVVISTRKMKLDVPTICAVVSDLTEKQAAEEELARYREHLEEMVKQRTSDLENANKEMESFTYSVSHDLRQPLRALEGFSDLLLEDYRNSLDATGKDYLDRIKKASQFMSELIDDMLKLSRITRTDMFRDRLELSEMALSIMNELQAGQPERTAEIVISPGLTATGDRHLLTIALRNLLENAWKFTSRCQCTRIEVGKTKKDGEKVYFVKDNGVGFDMQYKDKLFQPFQRLHSVKQYPGTGIGLAIVQRIVRRHDGKIWAESVLNEGSAFYFTLGEKE